MIAENKLDMYLLLHSQSLKIFLKNFTIYRQFVGILELHFESNYSNFVPSFRLSRKKFNTRRIQAKLLKKP